MIPLDLNTAWVSCPVCHEPHMRKVTDVEGFSLIHCTNHLCRSNMPGDQRASASLTQTLDAAVEYLGGVADLQKTLKGREVLAQIKRIFDPAPRHPAQWDDVKSAMLAADLCGKTRGSQAWCEHFANTLKARHNAEREARELFSVSARKKPFALVRNRFFNGEISIAVLQSDGAYLFSDGDCHVPEGNVLDMFETEFLTHCELENYLQTLSIESQS